jgi:hypothetical protein
LNIKFKDGLICKNLDPTAFILDIENSIGSTRNRMNRRSLSNTGRKLKISYLPSSNQKGYRYGQMEQIHEDVKRVINHDYLVDSANKLEMK